jgi:hypothetical protein
MIRSIWAIALSAILISATTAGAQNSRSQGGGTGLSAFYNNDDGSLDFPSLDRWLVIGAAGVAAGVGAGLLVFGVPPLLLGDAFNETFYYAPYPYAGNYCGYQFLDRATEYPLKTWAVRLTLENGNDFDGVNRLAGQLKFDHESRWGILSTWNYYHENLGGGQTDDSLFGSTNVTFRFAQNQNANMYTGLGLNVLTGRQQTNFGVNITYGGDWYPIDPVIVSAQIDVGTLSDAWLFHGRTSVGAIFHGCEFFVGYDFLRIGSTNVQGPMAGVRFWF